MLATLACGRFGFDFAELRGSRAGGGGGMGGAANVPEGGAAGSAGAASGAGGSGAGAGGAGAESANPGDSGASDAAADSGDAGIEDGGLDPPGCASDVPLRRRPEGDPPSVEAGIYDTLDPGWSRLARNSEWFQVVGQGYVALRWDIEYSQRAGQIDLPTLAHSGTFLRVGGGGGYHLDDPRPGTTGTYMGNAQEGISYMQAGAETPWHIEFYYLDGEVTITLNEATGLHNIEFQSQPYSQLTTPGVGVYAPGVVCDRE